MLAYRTARFRVSLACSRWRDRCKQRSLGRFVALYNVVSRHVLGLLLPCVCLFLRPAMQDRSCLLYVWAVSTFHHWVTWYTVAYCSRCNEEPIDELRRCWVLLLTLQGLQLYPDLAGAWDSPQRDLVAHLGSPMQSATGFKPHRLR